MIEIKKLNKFYNKGHKNQIHVINNTSLSLPDKGLISLLGPSGCGKTTLLNVIGGLDKVKSGKIYIDNKRITRRSSYKIDKIRNMKIGYIFQDYKLLDNMTVSENVSLVLKMLGIKDKKEINKRVDYILERVGMYRYRKRPCSMLSGGERQRVGIARALVKNPDIILADEPTGNLDSKNTIEIMNIIKSISQDKLVILVTHEVNLAKFYSTRIIELLDGSIVKDYVNDKQEDLDYRVDNKIYLKDFKHHYSNNDNSINIDMYSDKPEKLNLTIVFKNGNIYIENEDNDKIEVIDSNSNLELINDNYKKLDKSIYEKYSFDFDKIINKDLKLKYSSIFNIFSLIKYGFNKVFSYSIIKRLLLVGFFLSSTFTTYAISNVFGISHVEDKDFVSINQNYLMLETSKNNYNDYLSYKNLESVDYIIPGDSKINLFVTIDDYYQTRNLINIKGSLSSAKMIASNDIIYGRMPENNHEIVIDTSIFDGIAYEENSYAKQSFKQSGIYKAEDLINKEVNLSNCTFNKYTIVGITNKESPSIYVDQNEIGNILKYSVDSSLVYDYELYKDYYGLKITSGRAPQKDYEIIVHENLKEVLKLNKNLGEDAKINNHKLKVVGYYTSKKEVNLYFASSNTSTIELITTNKNILIAPKDKEKAILEFHELGKYPKDIYKYDKEVYLNANKDSMTASLILAGIMLVISLIEIILMVRSSFLSRIKEVGIFRAIGVKKSDIYKMFSSESFAISTLASLPGVLFMSYCLYAIRDIAYIGNNYLINGYIILLCLIFVYSFNIIIGLIPVYNTMRHTPARILSSHEVD